MTGTAGPRSTPAVEAAPPARRRPALPLADGRRRRHGRQLAAALPGGVPAADRGGGDRRRRPAGAGVRRRLPGPARRAALRPHGGGVRGDAGWGVEACGVGGAARFHRPAVELAGRAGPARPQREADRRHLGGRGGRLPRRAGRGDQAADRAELPLHAGIQTLKGVLDSGRLGRLRYAVARFGADYRQPLSWGPPSATGCATPSWWRGACTTSTSSGTSPGRTASRSPAGSGTRARRASRASA